MAQSTENPGTSGSSGAGTDKGGEQRRKIGGKYDSVEDAVEELIKTRDSAFHETREELGAIKQLLERAMTPIGRNDYNGDQGYRRDSRDDDDQVDAAEFLATPQKVFKRREEKLRQQLEQTNQRAMSTMIGNAAIVLRFQMKNPDLDEHEDLVQSFLGKTNPNDNLAKRLAAAGKATRSYLAKIKGSNEDDDDGEGDAGRHPDNEEFVEGSAKPGQGSKSRSKADEEEEPTSDSELGDYINERKAFKSSRFMAPTKK